MEAELKDKRLDYGDQLEVCCQNLVRVCPRLNYISGTMNGEKGPTDTFGSD